MKKAYVILILFLLVSVVFASDVDNLFFKLSEDFCNQIYIGISHSSSPSSLNSLAVLNENYSLNGHFSRIFSDQLAIDLSKKVQIVDREHLKSVLAEKKLDLAGLLKTSQGYAAIGNIANVKAFLSLSIYSFTYKAVKEKGFFTESKGYEGSLSGSYRILGIDSAYKAGSNIEVKDKYLTITKHFAKPISYLLVSSIGAASIDYYYFSGLSSYDLAYRLSIDILVGAISGWVFGELFYNILP
jgi:hypothetical protein